MRTYFAEIEWQRSRGVELEARYELEHDDLDTYHVVRLGMRWGF